MIIFASIYKFALGNNLDIYVCIYVLPASKDYSTTLVATYLLGADLDAGLLSWSPFLHIYACSTVFISIDVHDCPLPFYDGKRKHFKYFYILK